MLAEDAKGLEHLPGLANVDHLDTIGTSLPEVLLHMSLQILAAKVAVGSNEHLNVLAGGIEDGWKACGRHLD